MVLLAPLKYRKDYPEFVVIPNEEIHDGMLREWYGNLTPAQIIELWDEQKHNLTAFQMWRRKMPRCKVGKCRSRMYMLFDYDAYVCRWGHIITGRDIVNSNKGRI